jgi:hypothetical protein
MYKKPIKIKLVSHVNADCDILPSWFEYYSKIGVHSFHLIAHGALEENSRLLDLSRTYNAIVEDSYDGEFSIGEKQRRINTLLKRLRGEWILLVDSDEFVEFPYNNLPTTVRKLEDFGANALSAPMIQRFKPDGSLETPEIIDDPFDYFPLCSTSLYRKMGVNASNKKYPLFFCMNQTNAHGGNHFPPNGTSTLISESQGVTHHFKWRTQVIDRLRKRSDSTHPFRLESAAILEYLENRGYRLPTTDSFYYSRPELFRRGLLARKPHDNGNGSHGNHTNSKWWEQVFSAVNEIELLMPREEKFILVDDNKFGLSFLSSLKCIPFLENRGQYWGHPSTNNNAIQELERMRREGIKFIVFGFPAFWWFDYYSEFAIFLRSNYRCIFGNERIIVFDIHQRRQ